LHTSADSAINAGMSSVPTGGRGYATAKEPAHNSVANIPDALMITSILDCWKQAVTLKSVCRLVCLDYARIV
jgi:hypothetical protein